MTIEEQFIAFVKGENENAMLDLLRQSSDKERKEMGPTIKKLGKHYNSYKSNGKGQYSQVGTDIQTGMLLLAAFVCLPEKDFKRDFYASWIIDPVRLNKVKDWYCPSWFSGFVNSLANGEYLSPWITYSYIMQLQSEGLVQASPTLVARTLINVIYEYADVNKKRRWYCKSENLYVYPATLQEHIWYLFEVETSINYSGRYYYDEDFTHTELNGWMPVFVKLADEGRISRSRLLKEALLASNKNFTKNLSGWFAELFSSLKPAEEELLNLQPELFSVLSSPLSKPVTEVLTQLKKICKSDLFDAGSFASSLPALLSSNTKNTVAAALMLLEQTVKIRKHLQPDACLLSCQALIHHDESLQTRAAKLIVRYGDVKDETLRAALAPYKGGILQAARILLAAYFDEEPVKEPVRKETDSFVVAGAAEMVPLPVISNTDDIVFLASQAFDNNESWHFDMLPAAIIQFQDELKGPVLAQLQPALQRALKLTKGGLRSGQGYLDHLLAVFFIDVCVHLVRQHPTEAASLDKTFEDFTQRDNESTRKWMNIDRNSLYTDTWSKYYKDPFYEPFRVFLTEVLQKLRRGDKLPLLSTPTHAPGWVDAVVLVDRMVQYQQQGVVAQPVDGQLALARCNTGQSAEAIAKAREKLAGGWLQLALFLLGDSDFIPRNTPEPAVWMVASLTRRPHCQHVVLEENGYYVSGFEKYSGQLSWRTLIEEYDTDRYDAALRKSVRIKATRKLLKIDFPQTKKNEPVSTIKGLLGKLNLVRKSKEAVPCLYDYLEIKAQYFTNEQNDIRRVFMMIPNHPEAFLSQLLYHCMKYPDYIGENDKRMVVAALQVLHENWQDYGDMAHLFLATSMLSADKTASGIAAEIWLQYAPAGKVDSALVGRIIGLQESTDFAPLKRFTDLTVQRLFRVSPVHDRLLQTMAENILQQLPDEPIKNLKKLLEILYELAAANNHPVSGDAILQRLQRWNETEGLKRVTGLLMGR